MNILAIVSGAAPGKLSGALIKELRQKGVHCVGIARRSVDLAVKVFTADLLDAQQTNDVIGHMRFEQFEHIVVAHCVGAFKLELTKIVYAGDVDQAIWASNVKSMQNLIGAVLLRRSEAKTPVTFLGLGSLAEDYQIPIYHSYIASRLAVRALLRESVEKDATLGALYVKLCTVKVASEQALRPHANMDYWLEPEEFARHVVPFLLSVPRQRYIERDILVSMPDFDPVPYYVDLALIKKRWRHDMGEERYNRALE